MSDIEITTLRLQLENIIEIFYVEDNELMRLYFQLNLLIIL